MMMKKELLLRIKSKHARIGIIGLGYVGLPLALAFAKKGFWVTGLVRTKHRAEELGKGQTSIIDPRVRSDLQSELKKKNFHVDVLTSKTIGTLDILIVCVPTPIDRNHKPDITALRQVAMVLKSCNLDGKLIINESTVAPGMTREVFGKLGGTYCLVCSPERIDPGNQDKTVTTITKVVGGIDAESGLLAKELYGAILQNGIVVVSSLETAELVKMLENTYRAVNIALINEFAKLCQTCGVDVLELIEAAKTKWSFSPHYPGIGVGGHCIPVDPYYLLEYARSKKISMPVVANSLRENEEMVEFVADAVSSVYKKGMSILVYGLTYKKDVNDIRESPVLRFCEVLTKHGIPFSVYDPVIPKGELSGVVDIFVVGTDHKELTDDYPKCIGKNTMVIDGRNFFRKKVGKKVIGVGRIMS